MKFTTAVLTIISKYALADVQNTYTAGNMSCTSLAATDEATYDKVVIMLHGGGSNGDEWIGYYDQGWFGDLTGIKYVFPTSALENEGVPIWYTSTKADGCGHADECAYDMDSIDDSADNISALITAELASVTSGSMSDMYLGGFSQGAQLTATTQMNKLTEALGGVIVLAGYPLPPLSAMGAQTESEAQAAASYYGTDMNWFIWIGQDDSIFPAEETINLYDTMLNTLGASETLTYQTMAVGQGHALDETVFTNFVAFINGEVAETTDNDADKIDWDKVGDDDYKPADPEGTKFAHFMVMSSAAVIAMMNLIAM